MTKDPYRYFRIEAQEILDRFGKGVLALEKGGGDGDLVRSLLRDAHTLKGAARVVRLGEIADAAHAMEDSLAPLADSTLPVPRERIDVLLSFLDGIGRRLAGLSPEASLSRDPAPAGEESFRTIRIEIGEMDALLEGVSEIETQAAALGTGSGREVAASDRLAGVERRIRRVREEIERLRLLPVSLLFGGLERLARDAARRVERSAEFEGRGGEIRLDAHVLSRVQRALVQLVRNAVVHGIESEVERAGAAKSASGRVLVEVFPRGNRVLFRCSDDGRGVDLEAVRTAARRKGVFDDAPEEAEPEETLRLLLTGGLTTAESVTPDAGRGVGLDVVRRTVEEMGGEIRVETEAGKGTRVEFLVPVSLTSIEVLFVEAGLQAVAIPLDVVRRTCRFAVGEITRAANGATILDENVAIPFLPLAGILGAGPAAEPGRAWTCVIVEENGIRAGLGVDRILGLDRAVLRSLASHVPAEPVVAGASIDSTGRLRVVLDPGALIAAVNGAKAIAGTPALPRRQRILVIDDSLTTRRLEESILTTAGYEVDLAVSAEEGLAMARARGYGLFLVDVEMPGMDGFDFLSRVREDPGLREVPAVLVTSRDAPEDRARGRAAGAKGYITKNDFDQTEFLAQVRSLASR